MTEFRCWQCGVEPEVIDVTTLSDLPNRRYMPGMWPTPGVDHEHSVNPPTPEELIEQGRQSFDRIIKEWTS